jgi:hypothetical protein
MTQRTYPYRDRPERRRVRHYEKPAWHAEAIAMRDSGASVEDIAGHFQKAVSTVRDALGDHHLGRSRIKASPHVFQEVESRANNPRKIKALIAREAVMPAAIEFAAGRIDRQQLMARIYGARA